MENKALIEKIHELGQMIKEDPSTVALLEAEKAFNTSDRLANFVTEYNVQAKALENLYAAEDETPDAEIVKNVEDRINALYEQITGDEIYVAYIAAKENYEAYYSEVMEELQFAITGERPCTHDCSSCHGCH